MTPPELAVVVASEHGLQSLLGCLEALEQNAPGAEVIVSVGSTDDEFRRAVEKRFPDVRLVDVGRPSSIPELRAAGIFAAAAPYVAVLEDACRPLEGWAGHLLAAHRAGHEVVGGPIRNPQHRIRDWAAFLCEYSASMDPSPEGEADDLPGMNISYSRGALAACDDLLRAGHWESWLHPRLRDRGFRFWRAAAARVDHAKEFGCREFLSHCWRHARAHASARNEILGRRRLVYAVGSPLLPAVLYLRIARNVINRRSNVRELVLATPLILLYNAAWAAGEATGYVRGAGRDRLREP